MISTQQAPTYIELVKMTLGKKNIVMNISRLVVDVV